MSNIFQNSVDEHILHSLGDDVVFHIASFMDPLEASIISKQCLRNVEQRAADALQRMITRMTGIKADEDYMSHVTEAALTHCSILPAGHRRRRHRRSADIPAVLPQRLLLQIAHRIIVVTGAGAPEVNGIYTQEAFFENACLYSRKGLWKNLTHRFLIFQCIVNDFTRHWYISIVPYGCNPGMSSDIDFYSAPVKWGRLRIPATHGWVKKEKGQNPPPTISYMYPYNEQDHIRLENKITTTTSFTSSSEEQFLSGTNSDEESSDDESMSRSDNDDDLSTALSL